MTPQDANKKPIKVLFDCPYVRCDWPHCYGEDAHPLCSTEVMLAKKTIKVVAAPRNRKEPTR